MGGASSCSRPLGLLKKDFFRKHFFFMSSAVRCSSLRAESSQETAVLAVQTWDRSEIFSFYIFQTLTKDKKRAEAHFSDHAAVTGLNNMRLQGGMKKPK